LELADAITTATTSINVATNGWDLSIICSEKRLTHCDERRTKTKIS
jgi:hypothetical protein